MSFPWKVIGTAGAVLVLAAALLWLSTRGDEREVRAALDEAVAAWNRGDGGRVASYVADDFAAQEWDHDRLVQELRQRLSAGEISEVRVERAEITVMGDHAGADLRLTGVYAPMAHRISFHMRLTLRREGGDPTWRITAAEDWEGFRAGS